MLLSLETLAIKREALLENDLRLRALSKEGSSAVRAAGNKMWLDPERGAPLEGEAGDRLVLAPYTGKVLWVQRG